jgi:hypothetical protein
MIDRSTRRPARTEYDVYYDTYVRLVPDDDIVVVLRDQHLATLDLLRYVSEEQAAYRYAPDKWTLKQVVGHLVDVEWVFSYRALRFARGDASPLPGIDQEELVAGARFPQPLPVLLDQWSHLRAATVLFFDSMGDTELNRTGTASGWEFTVRSIAWIIAGHERHHVKVLKERYLGATGV